MLLTETEVKERVGGGWEELLKHLVKTGQYEWCPMRKETLYKLRKAECVKQDPEGA